MSRRSVPKRVIRVSAVSLWTLSLSMMVVGTMAGNEGGMLVRAWSLWVQMVAWGFTAWWIADGIARRDRLRVVELADIMARVAAEERPQQSQPGHFPRPVRLTRVH